MSSSPETGMPPRNRQSALRQRVWKGAAWILAGELALVAVRIGTLIILARLLTPLDFGIMAAALVVINFSKIFIHMGVGPSIIQLSTIRREHLSTAFITSLGIGFALQLIIWFGAPAFARYFDNEALVPVFRVVSFMFPIRGMSVVAFSLLQKDLRFKEIAMIDVGCFFIGHAIVSIGLALLGAGAWALVIGYFTDTVLAGTLYLILRKPSLGLVWERTAFRDLIRFGSGITLAQFANYFASTGDNLVIGRFLGLRALGLYTRAYGLMSAGVTVSGGILKKVLFPTIAKVQDDPRRLRSAYGKTQSAVALGVLPGSAYLIALAPETISVLLGAKWMEIVPVFRILAAGLLFRTGHQIALSVAKGTGAAYRVAGTQFFYAVCVVVGALVGKEWGIQGVSVGVLMGMILGYVAAARVALRVTSQGWLDFIKMHRSGAMLGMLVFTLAFFVSEALRWLEAAPWIILVGTLLVCGLVVVLWARHTILGPVAKEVIGEFRGILRRKQTVVGEGPISRS